ncbi:hypothetical protein [Haladaptatus cibarius]|uniref:hypothetical protein n=1 Tax=Haladaptatus cibarius TaxID=453847 RepID=UPI000678C296|nr:hypothetical protein [Haladaptatus cibarius]
MEDESELVGNLSENVPTIPPDGTCNGKRISKNEDDEVIFEGYCGQPEGWGLGPDVTEGRWSNHGGGNGGERDGAGAPEGNENAVSHGAFSKHFTRHLTDEERDAFDDAKELLGSPEGTQEVAQTAAARCLMQFDRSGDPRFLRRYENICDKFRLTPPEEYTLEVNGDHTHTHDHQHELTEQQRAHLDKLTGEAGSGTEHHDNGDTDE